MSPTRRGGTTRRDRDRSRRARAGHVVGVVIGSRPAHDATEIAGRRWPSSAEPAPAHPLPAPRSTAARHGNPSAILARLVRESAPGGRERHHASEEFCSRTARAGECRRWRRCQDRRSGQGRRHALTAERKRQRTRRRQTPLALARSPSVGTEVEELGRENGFFGNAAVKISMTLVAAEGGRGREDVAGYQKQVDEFILSMNRAAEAAVPLSPPGTSAMRSAA